MTNNKKKLVAILVILGLCIVIVLQGNAVNHNLRYVKKPTIQNRRLGNLGMYKWMTVSEIAKKHKVSENNVFKSLGITPKPGDEKLTLMDLRKKYGKSFLEMKKNLRKILQDSNGKKL